VTLKLHWLRLLQSSSAVHVTCVVPTGNTLPEGGRQVRETDASKLSETSGSGKATATPEALQATLVLSDGQSMNGGTVSVTTVTVNEQLLRFVQSSMASQ
jgi:hypothetical protein